MSSARALAVCLAIIVLPLVAATPGGQPAASGGGFAPAPGPGPITEPHEPGELLVRLRTSLAPANRAALMAQVGARLIHTFASGTEHWRLGPGETVQGALAQLAASPMIQYAEPNYLVWADVTPSDVRYPELWGLHNIGQTGGAPDADIDAPEAWGVSTGSRDVIVATLDTGVDYHHADLTENIWTNPGEIPSNGLDDEGNGFIDDVHGYDFVNNDGDPLDDNGHGTHTAGTLGAIGDNTIGVAGVCWRVSIMPIKFLGSGGGGSISNAVRALDYVTLMGVGLTNNSWGGGAFSQTLAEAIATAGVNEIAFIASSGNNANNNDLRAHYPSSYPLPNIISVAATDHRDQMAAFSNFGLSNVDLAAPGVNILSTLPGGAYGLLSGTSMAAPHVTGAAALLRATNPGLTVSQVKAALLASADPVPALTGRVLTGARLNAFAAIADPDSVPPGGVADLQTGAAGSSHMELRWTATGDDGGAGSAATYDIRYSQAPIDAGSFAAATPAGQTTHPGPAGQMESLEVRGLAPSTTYYFALKAFDEWGNEGALSNVASGVTLPPPSMDLAPLSLSAALRTGEVATRSVRLRNAAAGTLDFSIPTPGVTMPGVLAAGGPDSFGYRWTDSDQPGGPAFDWVEISTIGTPVPFPAPTDPNHLDDDNSGLIPLGFAFPFYGKSFSAVSVNCNGYMSFSDTTSRDFSNDPLPSTGSPANLLAPYHDDLHMRGVIRAQYRADGSRFIVQFSDVDRFSSAPPSPAHLTFQVVLHADGRIVYQYLSMIGVINSGSIGIQNADRSDGLTVVFNRDYVHDNLAVEIAWLPQWLTVTPATGRLAAGESVDLAVAIDATSLLSGVYPGVIEVLTNDPLQPRGEVGVSLQVTGASDLRSSPAQLSFGEAFPQVAESVTLRVTNLGSLPLHVFSITPSDAQIAVSESALTLPPFGVGDVAVTLTALAVGPFTGNLSLVSDDPLEPEVLVPITASVIPPPVMRIAPGALSQTLQAGSSALQQLEISNTGGSPLLLTAAADQGAGALVSPDGHDEHAELQGGPDAYGYRFRDSDEAGGPAYGFVDISASGTPISISGDDDLSAAIPMGMSFPFYGDSFSSLKVCTNGFVTLDPNAAGPTCGFINEALPSAGLPRWSIAPFWDDLHFRNAALARYQLDGSRFIIQFTGVDRIVPAGGSSLTFQIQLYNDGRIQFHYKLMASSTLNSATVGIQDGTQTIGLHAAFDESYIHDEMAILFNRVPDWLKVSPAVATIPAGGTQLLDVEFLATSRGSGTLTGAIVLGSNVPGQALTGIPATLEIIGSPQVGFFPEAIDFGQGYTGVVSLRSFQVLNIGSNTLTVSGVDATDPALSVEEPPGTNAAFELQPGELRLFNLRWTPAGPGQLDAEVRVFSDDPAGAIRAMPVTAVSSDPPVLGIAPISFNETLASGDAVSRTLRLVNTGLSDLEFAARPRSADGPGTLAQAGPDAFGYRWRDSDSASGPAFAWFDIEMTGSPVLFPNPTGDEENSGPVPIGFAFPFYGGDFTTVSISSNGWLSFTNQTSDFSNEQLPDAASPENLLAIFHDDLHFRGFQRAHYLNDGTRFIVQYSHVDKVGLAAADLTFQAILYPSGRIVYQYLDMRGLLNSATVGIQNGTQDDGLTVVFNGPYIRDGLAVEFIPPPRFVTLAPSSGTVTPGGSIDLEVRIDAAGLVDGLYNAAVELTTNDPSRSLVSLPLTLHVTGSPDLAALPGALQFPATFLGFSASLPLDLCNQGSRTVRVESLSIHGPFTHAGLTAPAFISPGFCRPLVVTFTPVMSVSHEGSIRVASDDPGEPLLIALLSGAGVAPPDIAVSPASINTALPPAGQRSKTITLRNTGSSPLSWSAGADMINATGPVASARGGPDRFGYRWRDSDQPGGPVFNWFDIRQVGFPLLIGGDDVTSGPLVMGFTFPFYGSNFSRVRISTNGWISFTSTLNAFENTPLPSTAAFSPENLIAPFWDDLHFRGQPRAWVYGDGTRLIIQYQDVDRHDPVQPSPARLTFQVILERSGRIVFQYLSMAGPRIYATVGIQNNVRDDGLTVAFNEPYIHDGLAVEITRTPEWIHLSPDSGTIPPHGRQFVTALLDAQGLADGDHTGMIEIESNDPHEPLAYVPVSLKVGTIPAELTFVPDPLILTPPPADDPNATPLPSLVRVAIELPPPYNPRDIRPGTIRINDTVKAGADSPQFTDVDGDGVEEMTVTLSRQALAATLPPGSEVPVTVQGEVADQAWFRATVTLRVERPAARFRTIEGTR